jgi:hypothetical protein
MVQLTTVNFIIQDEPNVVTGCGSALELVSIGKQVNMQTLYNLCGKIKNHKGCDMSYRCICLSDLYGYGCDTIIW